jgi:hypothetical protein
MEHMMISRTLSNTLALVGTVCLLAACGGGSSSDSTAAPSASVRTQSVASVALPPAPTGLSGNVTCNNFVIGAVALDSVIVPANAACRLEGTSLNGSLLVGTAATAEAIGISARGSVQAEGAAHVALTGSSNVIGAVQIKQGYSAQVSGNRLTGDVQIDAMRGTVLVSGNQVGGNVQVVGNFGGASVTDNAIKGNLQCKENVPPPVASGNVAALIEDQCLASAGGSGGPGGGGPTPPLAGNVTCSNFAIGAVALDSVIVPDNASCSLEGTRLNGSLLVGTHARVTATGVRVTGNVQAEGAASVLLGGASNIGGSVQLKQGGAATVSGAAIIGDLQIDAMRGPVAASGNRISGGLQVMANRSGVSLTANTIGGAMQCKDNQPAPTGSGNVASIKEDQCRPL